jgi:methanol metabolism-related c-type cytochrome
MQNLTNAHSTTVVAAIAMIFAGIADIGARAEQQEKPTPPKSSAAVKFEDGRWLDAKGNPTYKILPDGTVDWATFSGFRRFNGTCEVCHGPDGAGSSFGPDLTDSLKTISYNQFVNIVTNGRTNVSTSTNSVMPAFGTNKNVMCYLDDIYTYLRARSDGVLGRGRPPKHEHKPPEAKANEDACMGCREPRS